MSNVIIEAAEAVGEKRGLETGKKIGAELREEEILRNLISEGFDSPAIIKAIGVSGERLQEIREGINNKAV